MADLRCPFADDLGQPLPQGVGVSSIDHPRVDAECLAAIDQYRRLAVERTRLDHESEPREGMLIPAAPPPSDQSLHACKDRTGGRGRTISTLPTMPAAKGPANNRVVGP